MTIDLASFEDLNDELEDSLEKTGAGIQRIVSYFSKIDDTALSFYGLSNAQRDWLCTKDYLVEPWKKELQNYSALGISPWEKQSEPIVVYSGYYTGYMSPPIIDKALCHEFEHRFASFGMRKRSLIGKLLNMVISPLAPVLSVMIGQTAGAPDSISPCLAAGFAFRYCSAIVLHYPNRLEEKRCDEFSDRVVPEITYEDFIDEIAIITEKVGPSETGWLLYDFLDKAYDKFQGFHYTALANMIEDRMALKRFGHLHTTHPSNYTRIQRSEKNCPLYLEEKKRLGIPSLIIG